MPSYEDMTTAEQYAVVYPDRAAAIRRHSGMPPGATFPPPDRDIVREIVTSNSQVFLALDANLPPAMSRNPRHSLTQRFHETMMGM